MLHVYCVLTLLCVDRLAPECLTGHNFTSSSDVWAFAVTLWEMFSGGTHPWSGMSGDEVGVILLDIISTLSTDVVMSYSRYSRLLYTVFFKNSFSNNSVKN